MLCVTHPTPTPTHPLVIGFYLSVHCFACLHSCVTRVRDSLLVFLGFLLQALLLIRCLWPVILGVALASFCPPAQRVSCEVNGYSLPSRKPVSDSWHTRSAQVVLAQSCSRCCLCQARGSDGCTSVAWNPCLAGWHNTHSHTHSHTQGRPKLFSGKLVSSR